MWAKYKAHPNGPEHYHCDTKIALPGTVYTLECSMPVRSVLQKRLSWILTDYGNNRGASYQAYASDARQDFLKTPDGSTESYCSPTWDGSSSSTSGSAQISLAAAVGPLLISIFVTAGSILVWLVTEVVRHQKVKHLLDHSDDPFEVLLQPPDLLSRLSIVAQRKLGGAHVAAPRSTTSSGRSPRRTFTRRRTTTTTSRCSPSSRSSAPSRTSAHTRGSRAVATSPAIRSR